MKKKIFISLLLSIVLSNYVKATSALASSFGWNGVDDTQALYNAFTSSVDTLYVDLQIDKWVSGPLIFNGSVNNKVIIFERDVEIGALEGAYDSFLYNGLFTFINCTNVSLQGYGATLKMNKQEYINLNDNSEWRHIIALNGCNNFEIFGFELLDSGGDAIEISGIWQQPIPSTNIHIKNCKIDNNYRQGISITSAQNVLIEHCNISNTSGTPPAFGIDLEPDYAYDVIQNINIKNCRITNNEGGGILLAFWQLDQTTNPVSVNITDCYIGSNQNQGIVIDINSNGPVQGYANFERCVIENQQGNAIFSNKRESLLLTFKDIVIRNVGTNGGNYDMPIFIQKQFDYTGFPLGNIIFDKIFIDDSLFDRKFLDISHWNSSTQIENVTGDFYIYNPNGATYYLDPPVYNVNITTQILSNLPLSDISIYTDDNTATEFENDNIATFTVNRNTNIGHPLAIYFDVEGVAINRIDYNYFSEVLVIPSNLSETTYNINAISDELTESIENINLTIKQDSNYTILNENVQLFIEDFVAGINEGKIDDMLVFPNPAKDFINFDKSISIDNVEVFDILGQLKKSFNYLESNRINIPSLKKGIYILKLNTKYKTKKIKFIKN